MEVIFFFVKSWIVSLLPFNAALFSFVPALSSAPAYTDFVRLSDWTHGNEGPTVWSASMSPEEMVVGGPAVQLDASIFSNLRPHRVPAAPLGTPVVKLYAHVRLKRNKPYDPSNDSPRFQHRAATAVSGRGHAFGLSSSSGGAQPVTPALQATTWRGGDVCTTEGGREGCGACGVSEMVLPEVDARPGASPSKKQRLKLENGDPTVCTSPRSPMPPCDPEHPYGRDLYEEDHGEFEDHYAQCVLEEGGEPGVERERRGGEMWNVWHHGGDNRWENHIACYRSYGVAVNGITWKFDYYDARRELGTVSETPQIVTGPVAAYGQASYNCDLLASWTEDDAEDEFELTQRTLSACLSGQEGGFPSKDDAAGKTLRKTELEGDATSGGEGGKDVPI